MKYQVGLLAPMPPYGGEVGQWVSEWMELRAHLFDTRSEAVDCADALESSGYRARIREVEPPL